jgi:nucleoside triphosphate diphosphatase
VSSPDRSAEAVADLDAITRRLRRDCPWDREQDARSIVPHTVEEAYELADAAARDDDAKLLDELGDVLFQVHFLALLLEERGTGDLAAVADHCKQKLIRRHPHVFGEGGDRHPPSESAPGEGAGAGPLRGKTVLSEEGSRPRPATSEEVLENWDRIKVEVEGRGEGEPFAEVPENLPALLYARKLQRRAASRLDVTDLAPDPLEAAGRARRAIAELEAVAAAGRAGPEEGRADRQAIEGALGEALFALVDAARQLRCDPELALRATARSFRERHQSSS